MLSSHVILPFLFVITNTDFCLVRIISPFILMKWKKAVQTLSVYQEWSISTVELINYEMVSRQSATASFFARQDPTTDTCLFLLSCYYDQGKDP